MYALAYFILFSLIFTSTHSPVYLHNPHVLMPPSRHQSQVVTSIRDQTRSGVKAKKDLSDAEKAIDELFSKINEIKTKAEQSESMVHEICRDIKALDYGKRNLTTSITTLKRLHMLSGLSIY